MDEDAFNMSVRKFLKTVGVTAQREIEKAVRAAADAGQLPADGRLKAKAVITLEGVALAFAVGGDIELGGPAG
ncbi:MAG TPA: DUF6494 family protein [Defluviicoccus sp.]|nr:DUF6494 family protein [Defluviicoccus sp.]